MKDILKYRDNFYFNDKDYYLLLDVSLKRLYISKIGNYGGSWYVTEFKSLKRTTLVWSNGGPPQFKILSVPCINVNELLGLKIKYKNTELTGKIIKCVLDNFGILWDSHLTNVDFKKYGFPYFWNMPKDLELL